MSSSEYESGINIEGDVLLIGDIHGKTTWASKLCNIDPCSIIILGDIGFGFSTETDNHLQSKFEQLDLIGWKIYLVRGNHDNPIYWKNIQRGCTMLPDNKVITINGKRFFVSGGGVSIDRYDRKEDVSYWREEFMHVPSRIIREVTDIYGILSHVGPTPPKTKASPTMLNYFLMLDRGLEADLEMERIQIDRLKCLHPEAWYYGHFHQPDVFMEDNIKCVVLGINEVKQLYV